jgi:hypothetical protein
MNLEDAQKLCPIIAEVDDGCSVCVQEFINELNRMFPNLIWTREESLTEWPSTVTVREALCP